MKMNQLFIRMFCNFFSLILLLFDPTGLVYGSSGDDCKLISMHSIYSVNKKELISETTYLFEINNREGEKFAWFSIAYSDLDKLTDLRASIEDVNGVLIRELGRKEISTVSDIYGESFYSDYYRKEFSLSHDEFPYHIRLSITYSKKEFVNIADWTPVYSRDIPTLSARLTLTIPLNYKVELYQNLISKPVSYAAEGRITYEWLASYDTVIPYEIYSPPFNTLVPRVVVVPQEFSYGISGQAVSWPLFGKYFSDLLQDSEPLPESEQTYIRQLVEGLTSETEKISTLYHYLQDNTRYIDVAIDIGGLKPHSPAYVSQNKYGDCKALTLYMRSILETVGIKSYYTLINAGRNSSDLITKLPGQQFDHVILMVPNHGDTLWLECTNKQIPTGYVGSFIQDRNCLVINGSESFLAKTPSLFREDVHIQRNIIFNIDSKLSAYATIQFQLKGYAFERILAVKADVSRSNFSDFLEDGFILKNFHLDSFKIEHLHRDTARIGITTCGNLSHFIRPFQNGIMAEFPALPLPIPEKLTSRITSVCIPYPISLLDTLEYHYPLGWAPVLLENKEISSPFGNYTLQFKEGNGVLILIRNYELVAGRFSKISFEDLTNFLKSVSDVEKRTKLLFHKKS